VILAGDIGGTKSILGLFSCEEEAPSLLVKQSFLSRDYRDFYDLLAVFLGDQNQGEIQAACFGVAGPVLNQSCKMTHLSWRIEAKDLARRFKIAKLFLLNDLEATAFGVLRCPDRALSPLNPGVDTPGVNKAVLAAGTGLGEALLFCRGGQYEPSPSEAGNADFAPRSPLEIALLEELFKKYKRVSLESILSGPGLVRLYQFFLARMDSKTPPWLVERFASEDCAQVISETALLEKDEVCIRALDLFVSIYGAEAGNLALRSFAIGGIYIGGGIAPKILKKLQGGGFMSAFLDKGRFGSWLERIPVQVILEPETALYGAAAYARKQMNA